MEATCKELDFNIHERLHPLKTVPLLKRERREERGKKRKKKRRERERLLHGSAAAAAAAAAAAVRGKCPPLFYVVLVADSVVFSM